MGTFTIIVPRQGRGEASSWRSRIEQEFKQKTMGKFTLRLDRNSDPRKPFRSDEQPLPPEKARLIQHQDVLGSRLRFGFTVVVTFILGFGLSAVSFSLFNILFNGAPWPHFL
jgi:hypothetical protein